MCIRDSSNSKSTKKPLLFDIRLKNVDNDVILLKGPPHEAPSVLLSGCIVLSINEPMQIKSISVSYTHLDVYKRQVLTVIIFKLTYTFISSTFLSYTESTG